MQHYSLITIFSLKTNVEKIWDVLMDFNNWNQWWDEVKDLSIEKKGEFSVVNLTIGAFIYKLKLRLETYKVIPGKEISFVCEGDLLGKGSFLLTTHQGITTVHFHWNVKTTKKWMNVVAPFARPLFITSHHKVMHSFVNGISNKLRVPIIKAEYLSQPV